MRVGSIGCGDLVVSGLVEHGGLPGGARGRPRQCIAGTGGSCGAVRPDDQELPVCLGEPGVQRQEFFGQVEEEVGVLPGARGGKLRLKCTDLGSPEAELGDGGERLVAKSRHGHNNR